MSRDQSDFLNLALVEQPNGDFGAHDRAAVPARCLPARAVRGASALERRAAGRDRGEGAEGNALPLPLQRRLAHAPRRWNGRESSPRAGGARTSSGASRRSSSPPTQSTTRWQRAGIAPSLAELCSRAGPRESTKCLPRATLKRPADIRYTWHGKRGEHTEHLGYLLAEMQFLHRAYPGASW